MDWRGTDDMPLSEPMMSSFDNAYLHHSGSRSYGIYWKQIVISIDKMFITIIILTLHIL